MASRASIHFAEDAPLDVGVRVFPRLQQAGPTQAEREAGAAGAAAGGFGVVRGAAPVVVPDFLGELPVDGPAGNVSLVNFCLEVAANLRIDAFSPVVSEEEAFRARQAAAAAAIRDEEMHARIRRGEPAMVEDVAMPPPRPGQTVDDRAEFFRRGLAAQRAAATPATVIPTSGDLSRRPPAELARGLAAGRISVDLGIQSALAKAVGTFDMLIREALGTSAKSERELVDIFLGQYQLRSLLVDATAFYYTARNFSQNRVAVSKEAKETNTELMGICFNSLLADPILDILRERISPKRRARAGQDVYLRLGIP